MCYRTGAMSYWLLAVCLLDKLCKSSGTCSDISMQPIWVRKDEQKGIGQPPCEAAGSFIKTNCLCDTTQTSGLERPPAS